MARRLFFVDEIHSGAAEIHGDDAMHLTRVLRVEVGHRYEISDNRQLYLAEVEEARKQHVVFRVLEKLETRPAPVRMHLFAALIKFDHFEWTLEKATELGVARITPVLSERVEKGLDKATGKRMERWLRILKESAQQSRRWWLPEMDEPVKFSRLLLEDGLRLVLEESVAPALLSVLPEARSPEDEVKLLVGPEGGWADHERVELTEAGWKAVSLGPTVLRAETAAAAGLAVVSAAWQR
ncbi:MAG: RsmE family RNA methyltransferase [Bryobacteraceae bacterium]